MNNMQSPDQMLKLQFSDYFNIPKELLEDYGALNICLSSDLPLFIDPFLLFASEKEEYQKLHSNIVDHIIILKKLALADGRAPNYQLFKFPEIKQNWLGVCEYGNKGRGLGEKFAKNIIKAFSGFYSNFGEETISSATHIEKLTLVGEGIGKDFISDFTVNLILEYLLEYTQKFALTYLQEYQIKEFSIRCTFNSEFNLWSNKVFKLPYFYLENGDFIILTPIDILTKDDAFICHKDLNDSFTKITRSLDNSILRDSINIYFEQKLPIDPKKPDIDKAIEATINEFPELLDYYIKLKEQEKEKAKYVSELKRSDITKELFNSLRSLYEKTIISNNKDFFKIKPNSYEEALLRVQYLKYVIENNDGYRIFYNDKKTASEDTIQRMFRFIWFLSLYDVNSEVNNGRGPADYKISFGGHNSTIVEFIVSSNNN